MGREDRIFQLARLLNHTYSAHHLYEKSVLNGGRDIHWPEWYAEYLIGHGLDILVEDRLSTDQLENALKESRQNHRASGSKLSWEEFTARWIVEKLV